MYSKIELSAMYGKFNGVNVNEKAQPDFEVSEINHYEETDSVKEE